MRAAETSSVKALAVVQRRTTPGAVGLVIVTSAVTIETDTVREVTIVGPDAGREQAGQGIFADLVALARARGGAAP